MKIVPVVAFAVYSFGIYLSLDFIGVNGLVTLLVYAAMLLAYAFWREPHVIIAGGQAPNSS
jgi:ABC-type transport system involved in cytochrome c biogenesis permease subunit